jgi:arginyl-tRNA synthetase
MGIKLLWYNNFMIEAKAEIVKQFTIILKELGIEDQGVAVEHADTSEHGDYTVNVAMRAFPKLKDKYKSPFELAEVIKERFDAVRSSLFVKTTVVKPGFINLFLSEDHLFTVLGHFSSTHVSSLPQNENPAMTGQTNQSILLSASDFVEKKVMIEFTDPNPFKEFHIGHLYSNTVGESLSRLFEAAGAEVWRVNYQGDVGMHVAKALYGLLQMANGKWQDIKEKPLTERVKLLGEAYAKGAAAYEEDPQAQEEIKKINKQVFEKDSEIMPLYEAGRQWSMDYFETIYKRLGTEFKRYYFESEVGTIGSALVREYLDKSVFEESQGAIIFPGEKFGLHNRVFINSMGLPTYEAKELGLAPTKKKDFNYDLSIIVTGNEINEYFRVLLCALEQIYPDLASRTRHLSHGMVRLPEGKMSSRTGNILTGEWLLDEAKRQIREKFPEMDEETLEMVGVGAIKYALLKASIGRDIAFSFEESISLDGNSGPYIQYTYARTQSVLAKINTSSVTSPKSDKVELEEREVLRKLEQFESIVQKAVGGYSPHVLCTYLFELSQIFNLFYQKHKIVGAETEEFRVSITKATGNVLKLGLHLLGIKAPSHM